MTTLLPNPTLFSRWSFTRLFGRWMFCGFLVCLLLVMVSRVLGHGRATRYLITRFEYKYEFIFRDLETGIATTTPMPRLFTLSPSGCQLFMGFGERNYIHHIRIFDLRTARFSQFAIPKTYWNFLNPAWSLRNNKVMMFIQDKIYIANLMEDAVKVVDNLESHDQSRYPLSPNFNDALRYSEQQGTSQIHLIDLRTHEEKVIYQAGSNAFVDRMEWQWSSNERYLLGWVADPQREKRPHVLYDLKQDTLKPLTIPAAEQALWSPDSEKILFIAQQADSTTLYLYDIAQNNGFILAQIDNETSDQVLQWSPDSQTILVYHTRIKHVPQLLDVHSGQRRSVQIPAMFLDYRGGAVVSWSPNSRWLLIRSSVQVYAIDTVKNVLYPLEVSLFDIPAWHQNNAFYYLALEGDGYTLSLANLSEDGKLTLTEQYPYPLDQTSAWVCDEAM